MVSKRPTSVILLVFVFASRSVESKLLIENVNISTTTYDELHRLAILDQVDNYMLPLKSLETRTTFSLDGLYEFCLDPGGDGFHENWFNGSLSRKCQPENFYKLPVPSAFNDIVPNDTVRNYMGWVWYQTDLIIPQTLSEAVESQWLLQFESINYMAIIWLKDNHQPAKLIGSHVGGHLPVTLNVSQLIRDSRDPFRGFKLTVAVSNLLTRDTIPSGRMEDMSHLVGHSYAKFKPDFDFFHFAGIMGHVNLIRLPASFIYQVEFNRFLLRQEHSHQVEFRISIYSSGDSDSHDLLVDTTCPCSERDSMSQSQKRTSTITGREFVVIEIPSSVAKPGQMFMEYCDIKVSMSPSSGSNEVSRTDSSNIGWHDVYRLRYYLPGQFAGMDRVLSGQVPLQGFGMHQEQLFSGRTMGSAAIMKDIYLLKQTGANLIRTSHYPYSSEYLDACDQFGIRVIAECPAVGLNSFSDIKLKLHKQILLEMMQRDHHHPSILMWSVANEPQSQLDQARPYFESLIQFAQTDLAKFTVNSHRPLTAAIAQSHLDDKIGHLLDVLMINRYYGWYDYTGALEAIRPALSQSVAAWSKKLHNKPIILSEFGAESLAGLHRSTSQIFSEEYQRDLIVEHERVFDELSASRNTSGLNFIGSMIWNFADFSTHESLERVGANRKGIYSQAREPKLAVESVRSIYRARLGYH